MPAPGVERHEEAVVTTLASVFPTVFELQVEEERVLIAFQDLLRAREDKTR